MRKGFKNKNKNQAKDKEMKEILDKFVGETKKLIIIKILKNVLL